MDFAAGFCAIAVLAVVVRPFLWRSPRVSPLVVQCAAAAAIHVLFFAAMVQLEATKSYWNYFAAYCFAFMCYLLVFNALYKSISLRVFVYLFRQRDGHADENAIWSVVLDSFRERMRILETLGMVQRDQDRLTPTPKGVAVAARINALRRWIGIMGGGIYFRQ